MPHAVMVSGAFPCIRVGKTTEALKDVGWTHSVVSRMYPPQLYDEYTSVITRKNSTRKELAEAVHAQEGALIHVHNEPNWPVAAIKDIDDRPLIFNTHDVTLARPGQPDPNLFLINEAYELADGLVFVSEEQRDFAISKGLPVEGKPYCCIGNYASKSTVIQKPVMPRIGGICYAGGADPRGAAERGGWRDMSPVADALNGELHMYPGNPNVDYGINHGTIYEYRVLMHRLSQHDWGFTGTPVEMPAWSHSLPNKVYEYFAAGIPFIAYNNPLLKPLADEGLGIYLDDLKDIKKVAKLPKREVNAYKKRVRERRYEFTMGYQIMPLLRLYKEVAG